MSSGHYSLQDSLFFGNSSSSEWVLVRGMTATWVALIARSRIISNQQYVPCSLYQMCLVHDTTSLVPGRSSLGNATITTHSLIDSPQLLEPVIVALQRCPPSVLPSGKKKKKKKKPLIHPCPLKPMTTYAWKMLKAVHPEELSPSKEP